MRQYFLLQPKWWLGSLILVVMACAINLLLPQPWLIKVLSPSARLNVRYKATPYSFTGHNFLVFLIMNHQGRTAYVI